MSRGPATVRAMWLSLLLACQAKDPAALPQAAIDPLIPTVLRLSWSSTTEGHARVRYGATGEEATTPWSATGGTAHEVVVLGLKAGQDVVLRGEVQDAQGNIERTEPVELSLDPPPAGLPRFTLDERAQDLGGGYVLLSLIQPEAGWVLILDEDADPVWFVQASDGLVAMSPSPSRDGRSILFDQYDIQRREDRSALRRVALDGSLDQQTPVAMGHHDFAELPEGQLAWISARLAEGEMEGESNLIAGDEVRARDEGEDPADGHVLFSYWDQGEPYAPCAHVYDDTYGVGAWDWTHANSLVYREEDDTLWLLSKNLDSLHVFEASTGALRFQVGGVGETMTGLGEDPGWSHGHLSHVWEDGFVIFDNGYHTGNVSHLAEYRLDHQAGTYERVWEYAQPEGAFVPMLGDVRKLPDASYLASWTTMGRLQRVDADGAVLWQAESELGAATGRVTLIEDLYTLDRP